MCSLSLLTHSVCICVRTDGDHKFEIVKLSSLFVDIIGACALVYFAILRKEKEASSEDEGGDVEAARHPSINTAADESAPLISKA